MKKIKPSRLVLVFSENAQVMYQLPALDSEGNIRHFEKPLFLTCMMFVAMLLALPIYYIQQVTNRAVVVAVEAVVLMVV